MLQVLDSSIMTMIGSWTEWSTSVLKKSLNLSIYPRVSMQDSRIVCWISPQSTGSLLRETK